MAADPAGGQFPPPPLFCGSCPWVVKLERGVVMQGPPCRAISHWKFPHTDGAHPNRDWPDTAADP